MVEDTKELTYKLGETVSVVLPGGSYTGKIKKILPDYGQQSGETHYEISGGNFLTITSARAMTRERQAHLPQAFNHERRYNDEK